MKIKLLLVLGLLVQLGGVVYGNAITDRIEKHSRINSDAQGDTAAANALISQINHAQDNEVIKRLWIRSKKHLNDAITGYTTLYKYEKSKPKNTGADPRYFEYNIEKLQDSVDQANKWLNSYDLALRQNAAIPYYNGQTELANKAFSAAREIKNSKLRLASSLKSKASAFREVLSKHVQAKEYLNNGLNRLKSVGYDKDATQQRDRLSYIFDEEASMRKEHDVFFKDIREEADTLIQKINTRSAEDHSSDPKGLYNLRKDLQNTYQELSHRWEILGDNSKKVHNERYSIINKAHCLVYEADLLYESLSNELSGPERLKALFRAADLYQKAVDESLPVINHFSDFKANHEKCKNRVDELNNILKSEYSEEKFIQNLETLWDQLQSEDANKDFLNKLNAEIGLTKEWMNLSGGSTNDIFDFWENLIQAQQNLYDGRFAKKEAVNALKKAENITAAKYYEISIKKLKEAENLFNKCKSQSNVKDTIKAVIDSNLYYVKRALENLETDFEEIIAPARKAAENKKIKQFYDESETLKKNKILQRSTSKTMSHDGIQGVSARQSLWLNNVEPIERIDQSTFWNEKFTKPFASFGEDAGGDALYLGRTYRFSITSGELKLGDSRDLNSFRNTNLLVKVYRKLDFKSADQTNIKPIYTEEISVPVKSELDTRFGKIFVNENDSTLVIDSDLKRQYGMELSIKIGRAGNLVLSHKATLDEYYYVVELKGYKQKGSDWVPTTIHSVFGEGQNKEEFLQTFSAMYSLSFSPELPESAEFIKKPTFNKGLEAPEYAFEKSEVTTHEKAKDSTSEDNSAESNIRFLEIKNKEDFKYKKYDTSTYKQSVELRDHELLDELLDKYGHSPLALAAFVQNEIELNEPLSSPRGDEAIYKDVLYPGIINRGALGTYLEGQGSPWEQCALLVCLLRKAGYTAGYAESNKTGFMKMEPGRLSAMLRMQVQEYTEEADHNLKFPWVVFYDEEEQVWRHLFPWIKDLDIIEGYDVHDFLPEGYETTQKWIRKYLENDPNILNLVGADGNDTGVVLFEKFIKKQLKGSGVSIDELGVRFIHRKHEYNTWDEFPRPFLMHGEVQVSASIQDRDELFTTFKAEIYSAAHPERKVETQPMRMAEIHNRAFYIYHEPINSDPNCEEYWVNVRMDQFSDKYSAAQGDFSDSFVQGPQQSRFKIDHTDHTVRVRVQYDPKTNGKYRNYLGGTTFSKIYEKDRHIDRGSTSSICITYGRVTSAMANYQSSRYEKVKTNAKDSDYYTTGALTYYTGVSYFSYLSKDASFLQKVYKQIPLPVLGFGLSKLTPDLTKGSLNLSPEGHLRGAPALRFPQVDMMFSAYNSLGNDTLHPEYLEFPASSCRDSQDLSIVGGSANEHQILNDMYGPIGSKHAISTVKLLQLANKRNLSEGDDGSGFIVVTKNNYEELSSSDAIFYGKSMSQIRHELGSQWTDIVKSFIGDPKQSEAENENNSYSVIVYITPGLVFSEDGLTADAASYKGAGSLTFSPSHWRAAISGNENYINGGYGGKLPNMALVRSQLQKMSLNRNSEGRASIGGVEQDGYSKLAQQYHDTIDSHFNTADRAHAASGMFHEDAKNERFQEVLNAFESRFDAEKVWDDIQAKQDEVSNNPTFSFDDPSLNDAASSTADMFKGQAWDRYQDMADQLYNNPDFSDRLAGLPSGPEVLGKIQELREKLADTGGASPQVSLEDKGDANTAGDPVDIATRAFYLNEVDLSIAGSFPFELKRNYNNQNALAGEFGFGWKRNIVSYLVLDENTIKASEDSGTVIVYRREGDTNKYTVHVKDNPDLIASKKSVAGGTISLFNNYIEHEKSNEQERYILKGADGSIRSYCVKSFPIQKIQRTRPYLEYIQDINGNKLSVEYGETPAAGNQYGQIIRIQNEQGSAIHFKYNNRGYVTEAYKSSGSTVKYSYDSQGDLTQVTLPDGSSIQYTYEYALSVHGNHEGKTINEAYSKHWLTREERPEGRVLENKYDIKGRVTIQSVSGGNDSTPVKNITFETTKESSKDDPFSVVVIGDPYGNKTTNYLYKTLVYKVIDPEGNTMEDAWYISNTQYIDPITGTLQAVPEGEVSKPNALRQEKDKRGLITRYFYDANGNIIQKEVSGANLINDGTTSISQYFEYDATNSARLVNSYIIKPDETKKGQRYFYESAYPLLATKVEHYVGDVITDTILREYETIGSSRGVLKSEIHHGLEGETSSLVTFENNEQGLPIKRTIATQTEDADHVTEFAYNAYGRLIEEIDPSGVRIHYRYDLSGRLTARETYDDEGELIDSNYIYYNENGDVKCQRGHLTDSRDLVCYNYDKAGKVTAQYGPKLEYNGNDLYKKTGKHNYSGIMSLVERDLMGSPVRTIDANGNITDIENDVFGRPVHIKNDEGEEFFKYDSAGNMIEHTDAAGNTTKYVYTLLNLLRCIKKADGTSEVFVFDLDGNEVKHYDGDDRFYTTGNDAHRTKGVQFVKKHSKDVWVKDIYRYDFRGNILSYTDSEGHRTHYKYDGLGRLVSEIDPEGNETTYSYDLMNRTVKETLADGSYSVTHKDALGRTVYIEICDANEQCTATREYRYLTSENQIIECTGSCSEGTHTIYTLDQNGNVLAEERQVGQNQRGQLEYVFSFIKYDNVGNPIESKDIEGDTTYYKYDTKNRRTKTTLPDGNEINYVYDAVGNVVEIHFPEELIWKGEYDINNELISEKLYSKGDESRFFKYEYDQGKLKLLEDPNGTIFSYVYDELNHLKEIQSNKEEVRKFEHIKNGQRKRIEQIDSQGNKTVVNRNFDANGNIIDEEIWINDELHQKSVQEWNSIEQRASLDVVNGDSVTKRLFEYDIAGKLNNISMENTDWSVGYNYHEDGSLVTRESGHLKKETVEWVSNSKLPKEVYSYYGETAFVKDEARWDHEGKMTQSLLTVLDLTSGNESGDEVSKGLHKYQYDAKDRLIEIATSGSFSGQYEHNGLDTLIARAEENGLDCRKIRQVIDERMNRIKGEKESCAGSGPEGVEVNMDLNGDVTDVMRLVDTGANADKTYAYGYDALGNITSITHRETGEVKKLTWNTWSQLIKVETEEWIWTAIYDGLGRRLQTNYQVKGSEHSKEIKSYYDPESEFLEIGIGVQGRTYWKLYGPDLNGGYGSLNGVGGLEALIESKTGETLQVLSNIQGDVIGYVNEGTTVFSPTYEAYGSGDWTHLEETEGNIWGADIMSSIGWRGRREDATGLMYLGARYYSPDMGRFVSPDPYGPAASMDLYAYANGDPINYFDPDGRCSTKSQAFSGLGGLAKKAWDFLSKGPETEVEKTLMNFGSGYVNKLTFEASNYLSEKIGTSGNVDTESKAYKYGGKLDMLSIKGFFKGGLKNLKNLAAKFGKRGKRPKQRTTYFGEGKKANTNTYHGGTKEEILKEAKRGGDYSKKVGSNPDIKVEKGKIVLQGVGKQFKGQSVQTNMDASDFL